MKRQILPEVFPLKEIDKSADDKIRMALRGKRQQLSR
jgi:hypothetical protein